MLSRFLFPHRYKRIGQVLLVPSMIVGLAMILFDYYLPKLMIKFPAFYTEMGFFKVIRDDFSNELICLFYIVGAILAGFSKEKDEDEFIARLRMEALVWSTYVNYLLLLLSVLLIYGVVFLDVVTINMFSLLTIFVFRFSYVMYKYRKNE
ncbi:MAG: hypothetical protein Q8862_10800 [Bacteroidota bacterium]|nr:hypothetical protein [Bacteroidota bacterium]MDP4206588.1 hypothetical protein [Bacteroidota bacterium]